MAYVVQAIVTKYLGPTYTKAGRIKATAYAGSKTVEYEQRFSPERAHAEAAKVLAKAMGWHGVWVQGGMPGDMGYAFVCLPLSRDGALPALGTDPAFVIDRQEG